VVVVLGGSSQAKQHSRLSVQLHIPDRTGGMHPAKQHSRLRWASDGGSEGQAGTLGYFWDCPFRGSDPLGLARRGRSKGLHSAPVFCVNVNYPSPGSWRAKVLPLHLWGIPNFAKCKMHRFNDNRYGKKEEIC